MRRRAAAEISGQNNPQKQLIDLLQAKVGAWADGGYTGASELSRVLLRYWFGAPHLLADDRTFFKWHAHQRRAVETVIYLYEVEGLRRTEQYAAFVEQERRAQKAPWAKLGLQMATGSGKTKVMSLLIVWAHLHWQIDETNSALGFGNTQLLLAPNLIVLQRLLDDFTAGRIFQNDPLVPPELAAEFSLQVVTPDNVPSEWRPSEGYLVVSNIQKLYPEEKAEDSTDEEEPQFDLFNPRSKGTPTRLDLGTPRLLEFVESVRAPLLIYNDEAHHVHDEATHYALTASSLAGEEILEGIAWGRVLSSIQKRSGIAIQCDLSATLFEENTGQWFRHTVYDYPLQQAIRDRIVKQPFMAKVTLQYKDGYDEPIPLIDDAATDAFDRYTQLIQAGIAQWKKEQQALEDRGLKQKALLFIVCANKAEAKQIAARLEEFCDKETGENFFAGKVIEIHIGRKEATNDKEWQKIREEIQQVDTGPYRAIVSVMMLKEGWDVRNVKVIVPLRPCDSRQLTERLLGRGLRRMFPPYWSAEGELKDQDRVEGLYVIRHPSFEKIIKNIADIIEEEPEGTALPRPDPLRTLVKLVEPEEERLKRDVPIPQIIGAFETDDDWVERIGRNQMPPLSTRFSYVTDRKEIEGLIRYEGAIGPRPAPEDAEPIRYEVVTGYASIDAVISNYAEAIRNELRLSRHYEAHIKGIVKAFLERCTFDLRGIPLSLDAAADFDEDTRLIVIENIRRAPVRNAVVQSVSKVIGLARSGKETPDVTIETRHAKDLPEFEAFPSACSLEDPSKCVHTVCYFDSADELRLAEMLEEADDVEAWLWNDQTGVGFRIQYSYEGRMPYYYPDFLVRLTDGSLYVIESKGSIRERDRAKQGRAERYVEILSDATRQDWQYLFLINDASIRRQDVEWWRMQGRTEFRDLVRHVENAATGLAVG